MMPYHGFLFSVTAYKHIGNKYKFQSLMALYCDYDC